MKFGQSYCVFLDQRITKLEISGFVRKISLTFHLVCGGGKIERVSSTLTISVGLFYRILSYLSCVSSDLYFFFFVLELSIISCLSWKNFNLFFSKLILFYIASAFILHTKVKLTFCFHLWQYSYSNVNLR